MATGHSDQLSAKLAASVRDLRRRYRKQLEICQRTFDDKTVHDLRVATRRMLAMLFLLESLALEDTVPRLRKTFKRRLDAFDDLRDTQVQLKLLKPLWRWHPEARPLKRWLRRREEKLARKLGREIKLVKQVQLERRLKGLEKTLRREGDPRVLAIHADSALVRAFEKMAKRYSRLHPSRPVTIHRLRIAFKRYRYLCEFLKPHSPQLAELPVANMQRLQAAMGKVQDVVVLLERLGELLRAGEFQRDDLAALVGRLQKQRQEHIDSFFAVADGVLAFQPDPQMRRPARKTSGA